jgi:hypothetical protein
MVKITRLIATSVGTATIRRRPANQTIYASIPDR